MQRPLSNSTCSQLWPIATGAAKSAIDCGAAESSLGAAPTAPKPSRQKLEPPPTPASSAKWPHGAGVRPRLGVRAPAAMAPQDTAPSLGV